MFHSLLAVNTVIRTTSDDTITSRSVRQRILMEYRISMVNRLNSNRRLLSTTQIHHSRVMLELVLINPSHMAVILHHIATLAPQRNQFKGWCQVSL